MVTASRHVYRAVYPGIILGFLGLFVILLLGDFNQVSSHFYSFQWQYFGLALLFEILNTVLKFTKNVYDLNQSGIKGIHLSRLVSLFASSYPLSATPSRVAGSYQSIWLSKATGIPVYRTDSIFMIDRLSDVLCVFLLAVIGTIAYPAYWPYFAIVVVVFMIATLYLRIQPGYNHEGSGTPNLQRFISQLNRCVDSNPKLFRTGAISVSLLLGVVSWITQGASLFFILVGLGLAPNLALIATSCLVLAFSMLMGIISTLPGGLGVIELAMAALLTVLLNFQPELAITATILFRLATFWIGFLFGILFWSVSGKSYGLDHGEGHIVQS